MEKIKIALIGTGSMGKTYAEMIDGGRISSLTLAAVCCRSSRSKQWAKENLSSEAVIFDGTEAMYEEAWRFDAVLVVTPHRTHPQLAIQAFEHGKHVFCDKPSGVSTAAVPCHERGCRGVGKEIRHDVSSAPVPEIQQDQDHNRQRGAGKNQQSPVGKLQIFQNRTVSSVGRLAQQLERGRRRWADQPGAAYSGYVAVAVRHARGCLRPDPLWKVQ